MSITPVNWATIPDAAANTTTTKDAASGLSAGSNLTDKSTFLKLLVAQIKNQNPLNPTDGIQFLTQLTQFSQLEQAITTNTDLTSIQQLLAKPPTRATSLPAAGSTTTK
jgi:flagellar basal-body rod modification protein FlgD